MNSNFQPAPEDLDDVSGHKKGLGHVEAEDDVEGHKLAVPRVEADDDDVEGHQRPAR